MKQIKQIQGLRFIAFLMIYTFHILSIFKVLSLFAVSLFFGLSGFVLIYVYKNRELKYDFKSSVTFTYNKIKKLYPLLIITYLCGAFFCFYTGVVHDYIKEGIIPFICDCLLLQSYYHGKYIGLLMNFNVVAWYLSTALFLYFCFPFILNKIKLISRVRTIIYYIFLIFIIMIIICFLAKFTYKQSLIEYFTYVCPLLRLGDFLIGCLFGILFSLDLKINKNFLNIFSVLIFLYVFILQLLWIINSSIFGLWYKDTLLFVLPACFLIYLIANNSCFLSKIFSIKLLVYLGNLSGFAFLIHTIVIRYFFYFTKEIHFGFFFKILIYIFLLIITILFSQLYNIYVKNKYKKL